VAREDPVSEVVGAGSAAVDSKMLDREVQAEAVRRKREVPPLRLQLHPRAGLLLLVVVVVRKRKREEMAVAVERRKRLRPRRTEVR
jgi:hypothetical protein